MRSCTRRYLHLCSHLRVIVEVLWKVQPEEVFVFVHRERSTGRGSQVFQANPGTAFCTHGRVSGCRSSSGPFVDWCDFGSPTVSSGPGVALSSCRRVVVTFYRLCIDGTRISWHVEVMQDDWLHPNCLGSWFHPKICWTADNQGFSQWYLLRCVLTVLCDILICTTIEFVFYI